MTWRQSYRLLEVNHQSQYYCHYSSLTWCSYFRPLSMPINLADDLSSFGSGQSQVVSQDVLLESSSGDSVDSVGFFRRFAGQFWSTSVPHRGAVYRKGLTDYSFRESPEEQSQSPANDERSPADTRPLESPSNPPPSNQSQSTDSTKVKVSYPNTGQHVTQVDCYRSTGNTSSESVATLTRTIKHWSDFGTRLAGFVDKVLLPADQQSHRRSMDCAIGVNKCSSVGQLSDVVTTPTADDNSQSESSKLGHVTYDVRMKRNIFNSVGGGASVDGDRRPEVKWVLLDYISKLCEC